MIPAAALFDFSATLFDPLRVVDGVALADRAERRGCRVSPAEADVLVRRIQLRADTADGRRTRRRCDLSAAEHRAGWVAVAEQVPGVDRAPAEAFHDCITDPARWHPYADTGSALQGLRARGVRIGGVSNCGWDVRVAFDRAGLSGVVDAYALSWENGCVNAKPALFRIALDEPGADPARDRHGRRRPEYGRGHPAHAGEGYLSASLSRSVPGLDGCGGGPAPGRRGARAAG